MKKILLMLATICVLTSCSPSDSSPSNRDVNENSILTPKLLTSETTTYNGGCYAYIVDKNTGVVYLEYDAVYRHALTVMLNADGTPITAEQLGIEY